jgi:hypothetical protein
MFERYFISIEIIGSHGIIILPCEHIVAPMALSLYMNKSKNTNTMYNLFKRWEKYRIFERSFISIEIIGSMGIIILSWLHMVAPMALSLYMNKSKILRSWKLFQKLRKVWDIWTFFHFYRKHWISWELLFYSVYIWSRRLPCKRSEHQRRSCCIWKNQKIPIPCITFSNVEKSMVCLNVISFL